MARVTVGTENGENMRGLGPPAGLVAVGKHVHQDTQECTG